MAEGASACAMRPPALTSTAVNGQASTAVAGQAPVVELRGIVKRFPGVVANDGVDFALATGEVHALLGENGAGKSTLMNILDGLYQPDAGEILIDGRPVAFRSPRDAIAAGLGMVHQHFTLVASMTVTENVIIGLDRPRFRLDLGRYDEEIGRLAEEHGLSVDPRREGLAAVRRRATAGRDPQGAVSRRPGPDHGRADGGPRAPGDRRPVPDAAVDDRGGAQRGVHQPQARRGPLDRRPDHRHAPGEGHGRGAARRGRHEGPAGHADGRPRGPREPGADVRCRPARPCSRSSRSRRTATRACPRSGASRSRSAPARSSASRPSRATARASWPRSSAACARAAAASWSAARTSPTGRSARRSSAAWPTCPRTAPAWEPRRTSRWSTT